MNGFLIVEEGPLTGYVVRLEEGEEWIIGRDPDVCYTVIEDPMVSRKHLMIHLTDDGFQIENLSAVNPAQVNGRNIEEPHLLQEGDAVQVGNTFMRFTTADPVQRSSSSEEETESEEKEEAEESSTTTVFDHDVSDDFSFLSKEQSRFLLKVTAGPNSGAEFPLQLGQTYVLGKDPDHCDLIFQDLSVSRRHAQVHVSEEGVVTIEDLGSRNGTLLAGKEVKEPTELHSQNVVAIGTTILLLVDREQAQETVVAPPPAIFAEEKEEEDLQETLEGKKSWKDLLIPTHHLVIAGVFIVLLVVAFGGVVTLFRGEAVAVEQIDEGDQIRDVLEKFPYVQFSFNKNTGALFLVGNVMTEVDHQEMMYVLKTKPFVRSLEDNVVIDELVWENTNAMIMKFPKWRGVSLTSTKPGHFLLKGYIDSADEASALEDWMNLNFPYTDKLTNRVVIESTLNTEVQSVLITEGFSTVTFQMTNGELLLAGRVNNEKERAFKNTIAKLKDLAGVHEVKSFVIFTSKSSDFVDLSNRFQVTGTSRLGDQNQFVVINGKILSTGEALDGMEITDITADFVLLEKDGIKYKINYNQQ